MGMKRIVLPTLLFGNVLLAKSVPTKAAVILNGNHIIINLDTKSGISDAYKVKREILSPP